MKKILVYGITLAFLFTTPAALQAETTRSTLAEKPAGVEAKKQARSLLDRLTAIYEMDKSKLSVEQKHQLRREVMAIETSLKGIGGGIYLSTGAVILIIILLIIFL